MSAPRGKRLNRLHVGNTLKAVPVSDGPTHIPETLFKLSSPKSTSTFPALPTKVLLNDISATISPKGKEISMGFQPNLSHDMVKPDVFYKTIRANQILKNDKEHTRADLSKKFNDVSYLMETKAHAKEKMNERDANIVKRSLNLLSPENPPAVMEYSILNNTQYREDKPISRRDRGNTGNTGNTGNIYLEMKEYGRDDSPYAEAYEKHRAASQHGDITDIKIIENRSLDYENASFAKTLPKIIDTSKFGTAYDLPDSPNKDELKDTFMNKVKKGVIVQKRAQNKNLFVPSGRKQVVQLSEWLTEMLEDMQKHKTTSLAMILDQTQSIYSFCLEELIRQVKVQCSERGQLLDRIWEAYMGLFDKAVEITQKEKKQLERVHMEEMANMRGKYEKEIENHVKNYEKMKKERDEKNFQIEKLIEKKEFLIGKAERLTQELFGYKHELYLAHTKAQIAEMNEEIQGNAPSSHRKGNKKGERKGKKVIKQKKEGNGQGKQGEKGKNEENEGVKTEEKAGKEEEDEVDEEEMDEEDEEGGDIDNDEDEPWKNKQTDTIDLIETMGGYRENLDKSVQWEKDDFRGEGEGEEGAPESEESEDDTQSAHSAQEIMEIQAKEEIRALVDSLDNMNESELQEIIKRIQNKLYKRGETEKNESKEGRFSSVVGSGDIRDSRDNEENKSPKSRNKKREKGTRKVSIEDVKDVLERYQEQIERMGSDVSLENEILLFVLKYLKGDQEWKLHDLKEILKKLTKRKASSLNLEQEENFPRGTRTDIELRDLAGEDLPRSIMNMEKEELKKLVETLEERLDGIIMNGDPMGSTEDITRVLKAVLEADKEGNLLKEKRGMLLEKVLQAFEQSVGRNLELKIENQEQALDLREMEEKRENNESQTRDLYKQVGELQEKTEKLQKVNDKLSKTLVRKKTWAQEEEKKMQQLSSVVVEYASTVNFDNKIDTEQITKTEIDFSPPAASILVKSVSDGSTPVSRAGEHQENSKKFAANLMNNIAEIMKKPNSDIEEEDWSGSERSERTTDDREERKYKERSSSKNLSMFSGQKSRARNTIILTKPQDGLKPKRIIRVTSVNGESANALLSKAKEKKNVKSSLTKPSLLKFMSQVYMERLKDLKKTAHIPLHVSVYEYFLNKYGLKKVAETKCLQIYEAAIALKDCVKIHRFRDLLGLGEMFEIEELELYLNTIRLLDTAGNGTLIASNTQEKIFVSFDQVEVAAMGIFESKLDPQNLREMLMSLTQIKSVDRVSRLVELEDVVDRFFYVQRNLQDTVKGFVKEIFGATDLDNDETIEFFEFNILYKHLEKERYDKNQVKELFFSQADLILSDDEPVLSFNRFAWICLEMKLFTEEKQRLFARADIDDPVQNVRILEEQLKKKMNEIRLRFMKSQTYTGQVKSIIGKLYSSCKNPQKSRNIVWLSYRLLDEESKSQLLEYEMKSMLPIELVAIQRFVDEMEGWVE